LTRTAYETAKLQVNSHPSRSSLEGSIWMMSDNAEASVRRGAGIVTDPALNAYVGSIVCKLAGPYCGEIRTYIVRVPDFNAMMYPNGTMVVWTGLLLRARNEAQLAAVLAHEIGHYLQRHGVQKMEDVYKKSNAMIFVQMATIAAGIPAAGDLANLATMASVMSFSRESETEADDVSLRLMVQYGYDPREAARLWAQVMEESAADRERSRRTIFFASHPPSEIRADRLARQAAYAMPSMGEPDTGRDRYRAAVMPHLASFLRDEFRMRNMGRLEVVLNQLAREEFNLGEVKFFQGELYRVRNAANDNVKALQFYDEALKAPDHPPEVYRSLGQAYLRAGQRDDAARAFREYLRRAPDASDRKLVETLMGS
jgi:predicted Zn-dependent protease